MSAPQRLRVRLDGDTYTVTIHRQHWLPRCLRTDGISVGLSIFCRTATPSLTLIGHELVHALHFVRIWQRTPLRIYTLAVLVDLALYAWEWIRSGFRYMEMAEEVRAYTQQYEVAAGTHPDIRILWEDTP